MEVLTSDPRQPGLSPGGGRGHSRSKSETEVQRPRCNRCAIHCKRRGVSCPSRRAMLALPRCPLSRPATPPPASPDAQSARHGQQPHIPAGRANREDTCRSPAASAKSSLIAAIGHTALCTTGVHRVHKGFKLVHPVSIPRAPGVHPLYAALWHLWRCAERGPRCTPPRHTSVIRRSVLCVSSSLRA